MSLCRFLYALTLSATDLRLPIAEHFSEQYDCRPFSGNSLPHILHGLVSGAMASVNSLSTSGTSGMTAFLNHLHSGPPVSALPNMKQSQSSGRQPY